MWGDILHFWHCQKITSGHLWPLCDARPLFWSRDERFQSSFVWDRPKCAPLPLACRPINGNYLPRPRGRLFSVSGWLWLSWWSGSSSKCVFREDMSPQVAPNEAFCIATLIMSVWVKCDDEVKCVGSAQLVKSTLCMWTNWVLERQSIQSGQKMSCCNMCMTLWAHQSHKPI